MTLSACNYDFQGDTNPKKRTGINIKVGVGKGYDGHVVKGISKTAIFEKMMLFHRD